MEEKLKRKKIIKIIGIICVSIALVICGLKFIPELINSSDEDEITVSVEIDCKELSNNPSKLTNEKTKKYIPENGIILQKAEVAIGKGATAFDALEKICEENDIQFDFEKSPQFGTFVSGVNYIYQHDAGSMSGWLFEVNNKTPQVGSSSYELKNDDSIRWYFSCGE